MNPKSVFKLLLICSIISILGFSIAHSASALEISLQNPLTGAETVTDLINRITGWILGIAGSIMMIVLIFAGFRYLTAGADEERAKNAKKMLTWAIIGIAIIVGAAAITNAVMDALGVPDTTSGEEGETANIATALDTMELTGDLNGDGVINTGDTIDISLNLTNDSDQDVTLNNVSLIAVADSSATGMNNLEQGDKKKVAGVSTLVADEQEILKCGYREYWIIREFGPITVKARETVGLHSEWTVLNIPGNILIQLETLDANQQQACALLGRVPLDGDEEDETSGLLSYTRHAVIGSSINEGGEPKVTPGAEVQMEVCLKNNNSAGGGTISADVNLSPQENGVSVSNNPRGYSGVDPQEERCKDYDFSIAADYTASSINFKVQGASSTDKVSEANIKVDLVAGEGDGECSSSSGCVTFQKYVIHSSSVGGLSPNAKVVPGATIEMDVHLENKTNIDFTPTASDRVQATLAASDNTITITNNPGEYSGMHPGKYGSYRYKFSIPENYNKSSIGFTIQGSKVSAASFDVAVDTGFKPNLTTGSFGSGIDSNVPVSVDTVLNPTFSINNSGAKALAPDQDFSIELYACYGQDENACAGLTSKPEYRFYSGSAKGIAAWWPQDGIIQAGGNVMVKQSNFQVREQKNLYFGIKIDTGDSVNESNENDNTGGPYAVEVASWNAEVKELTLTDDPLQGTKITYLDPPTNTQTLYRGSFKITNTGTGNTNLGSTNFYYKTDLIDGPCAESTPGLYGQVEETLTGNLLPGNSAIKTMEMDTRDNYPFAWQVGKSYKARIVFKDHNTGKRIPNKVVCAKAFTYGTAAAPTYNAKVLSASLTLSGASRLQVKGSAKNDSAESASVTYGWSIDKSDGSATSSSGCLKNASNYDSGESMIELMPAASEVTINKKIAKPTELGYYQAVVTANVPGDTDTKDNKKCSTPLKIESSGDGTEPTYDLEASRAELSYSSSNSKFNTTICVKNHSTQNGQPYSGFTGYYDRTLKRNGTSMDSKASSFTVGSSEKCFNDTINQTEPGDYQLYFSVSVGNQNTDNDPSNNSKSSDTVTVTTTPEPPQPTPADYKTEISTCSIGDDPDHPGAYWYRVVYENRSTRDGQPIRADVSWGIKMLRSSSWSGDCPGGGSSEFSYDNTKDCQANGVCADLGARNYKPSQKGYYHIEAWAGVSGSSSGKSYKCTSVVYYVPATSTSLDLSRANAFVPPLLDEQIKNFWKKLQEVIK